MTWVCVATQVRQKLISTRKRMEDLLAGNQPNDDEWFESTANLAAPLLACYWSLWECGAFVLANATEFRSCVPESWHVRRYSMLGSNIMSVVLSQAVALWRRVAYWTASGGCTVLDWVSCAWTCAKTLPATAMLSMLSPCAIGAEQDLHGPVNPRQPVRCIALSEHCWDRKRPLIPARMPMSAEVPPPTHPVPQGSVNPERVLSILRKISSFYIMRLIITTIGWVYNPSATCSQEAAIQMHGMLHTDR